MRAFLGTFIYTILTISFFVMNWKTVDKFYIYTLLTIRLLMKIKLNLILWCSPMILFIVSILMLVYFLGYLVDVDKKSWNNRSIMSFEQRPIYKNWPFKQFFTGIDRQMCHLHQILHTLEGIPDCRDCQGSHAQTIPLVRHHHHVDVQASLVNFFKVLVHKFDWDSHDKSSKRLPCCNFQSNVPV